MVKRNIQNAIILILLITFAFLYIQNNRMERKIDTIINTSFNAYTSELENINSFDIPTKDALDRSQLNKLKICLERASVRGKYIDIALYTGCAEAFPLMIINDLYSIEENLEKNDVVSDKDYKNYLNAIYSLKSLHRILNNDKYRPLSSKNKKQVKELFNDINLVTHDYFDSLIQ